MIIVSSNTKKIRSVPLYLSLLEKAGRSQQTIRTYREALLYFSRFLDVPLEELHKHLSVENLLAYTDSAALKDASQNTRRMWLAIIHKYMKLNGVEFDELETSVFKLRRDDVRRDKPLKIETLQKMMDLADVHMKAYLSFLISTGCRINESAEILITDIQGNRVTIRPEIAKGRHGGTTFLTSEAREYLDLWLRERDQWIQQANVRTNNIGLRRPQGDQRLFACTSNNLSKRFQKLYETVDGESSPIKGGTRNKITPHSCRAYFRTHAVTSMGIDLVEGIMRHTGYLNAAYVRMSDDERERLFHLGEHELYITRASIRNEERKIEEIRREQEEKILTLERRTKILEALLKIDDSKKK